MKHIRTRGIILARTNYGEADRILTFITPDHGKVKAIAKGVRKSQSKLAGGLELFSVSDLSFIPGKREIGTIVSTRLVKHFGVIVKDLDRTTKAYELIKKLDRATEDAAESAYFNLMEMALAALDEPKINLKLISLWFDMQLLRLAGHAPNLRTDAAGAKLSAEIKYRFDFEKMAFTTDEKAGFDSRPIKFLRLGFSPNSPQSLNRVDQAEELTEAISPIVQSMLQTYIRL
jgi:DNA repair protein RecO (recombination protein O)